MQRIAIALVVAALAASAPAFAQGGAGGGTGAASGGAASGATGSTSTSPGATTAPIQPPAPFSGRNNSGVSPSAPGPSTARTPPSITPTVRQPGYAGSSPRRGERNNDVQQQDQTARDAIQDLNKEIDRELSICRGC